MSAIFTFTALTTAGSSRAMSRVAAKRARSMHEVGHCGLHVICGSGGWRHLFSPSTVAQQRLAHDFAAVEKVEVEGEGVKGVVPLFGAVNQYYSVPGST